MSKRIAVVTGAGSGIGAAIARTLSERGAHVVATDLDEAAARRTADTCADASARPLDVTDALAARALADAVAAEHGALDVWVSNAGVSTMQRFLDADEEAYDRTLAVNLRGVFFAGQAAARTMVALGRPGAIVNVASMAGKQGRVPFLADYVASKFGVVGLTQAMAYELAEHGIRVNSVCPGYVSTPMQERELGWEAALRGVGEDEVRRMMLDDTPLRRLEEPRDVARVVAFLTGDDAGFVTGEAVAVNGGAYMD